MPSTFTLPTPEAGKELTIIDFATSQAQIQAAIRALQDASASIGTVTSISEVDSDTNADLLNVNITNPTTAPVLTFTKVATAANLIYASAVSVGSAKPTMRAMVAADLPTVPYGKGGNGLTTLGGIYQMLRVNSAGTANEWFTMVAASGDKITLTPSSGTPNKLTIDVDPTKIEINTLASTTPLSFAKGGTNSTSQQAAINSLTAVSLATNEFVLTKDTSTGNAIYKAQATGITNLNGLTGATVTIGADNIAAGATNKWYTATEIAQMAANTAKVTNATHTGDVTGSGALTIAAGVVTYAKMQAVTATNKILGRRSSGSGTVEEIGIGIGLSISGTNIITKISNVTKAVGNYQILSTDGTIIIAANSVDITLPDSGTIAVGDEYTVKNMAGSSLNNLKVFPATTDDIDGSTVYALDMAHDCVTVRYCGAQKWYIISKIVNV